MIRLLLALALLVPTFAHAWWNADWKYRKQITVNAAQSGVKETLTGFAVPIRLHTGNLAFADLAGEGNDLRFIASDDKTPLRHHVESFDAANEIAIVWVQMPRLTGTETIWMYYGNAKAPKAEDGKGSYDPTTVAVLHFGEKDGTPKDTTAYGNSVAESTAKLGVPSAVGNGVQFDGQGRMNIPASGTLKAAAGVGFTFSAWVKPTGAQDATLFALGEGPKSLQVVLAGSRVVARFTPEKGAPAEASAEMPQGAWTHVTASFAPTGITLFVNGAQAGAANMTLVDVAGTVVLGDRFAGEMDEVQLANVPRGAAWALAQQAAQMPDSPMVAYGQDEEATSGGHSYFGILIDNLTVDAWVVIIILMIMLVVSFIVMAMKAMLLSRTERANEEFLDAFAETRDLFAFQDGKVPAGASVGAASSKAVDVSGSTAYRLYAIATRELKKRIEAAADGNGGGFALSPQALDAIRASVDAGLVRENAKLNARMVLLTIAISGGPFLGLLGTVVGVMITFAAIAAAGDVNINAIAPGIAAALLATVAGLGVAIPALFGYNWLASRIKQVSADTQVFTDELITRFAERYAP
jgi:biopolymer transport protein ExbB